MRNSNLEESGKRRMAQDQQGDGGDVEAKASEPVADALRLRRTWQSLPLTDGRGGSSKPDWRQVGAVTVWK